MKKLTFILLVTCACLRLQAQVTIITTIAGTGTAAFSGDGGNATNATLNVPEFLRLDKSGNIFISDGFNQRIRKIDISNNVIATVGGNGIAGYNGDNILATNAQLLVPQAICLDTAGNIYIADALNNRIRKINASTGIITTVAGNGTAGNNGDNGLATNAELSQPVGLCLDNVGNIYIGDYANNIVRRVDGTTGIITKFAGTGVAGFSGDNGLATNAKLNGPIQVFADSSGDIYICDQGNNVIRKVDITTNVITTIAGTGIAGFNGDNNLAIHAQLNQPCSIFIDSKKNLFVVDGGGALVREIDSTGIIRTIVGTDTLGFSGDNGLATNAKINAGDVYVNNFGVIYIADMYNNRIREVYNPKLAIPNEMPLAGVVKLYPNPAGNQLSVIYDFTGGKDGILQITDMTGHFIFIGTLKAIKQKEVFNISNLSAGMYVYKVIQNNALISSGKLIKE